MDDWRAVPPEESTAGSTPPMPAWVKPALAGAVGLLVLLGAVIGASLGMANNSTAQGQSTEPSPAFALEPPLVVDEYVRGQSNKNDSHIAGQEIVQADYSDGTHTVVLVMTWPEKDLGAFLDNAGIGRTNISGDPTNRYCGVSEDTGQAACGEIIDEVGLLLVSVSEQGEPEVSELLDRFKEELGQ
ncbi:MAG: hypothetical protein Q4G35_08500 [Propionibacteriaceae bacterium]|nr:hypothetical protein [Propionibacteriaceae bacterium]